MTTSDGRIPAIAQWDVPLTDGTTLQLEARPGEVTTIVGANGSGKSALATWLAAKTPPAALRRVLAQRKIWLQSSGSAISAANREHYTANIETWDRNVDSRYLDHADSQRADITLFDLLGKIHAENQRVADMVYSTGATPEQVSSTLGPRLSTVINSVLEAAGLHISVHITDNQTVAATHRTLGITYPISQMSDGERSALLLAAEILTAPSNAVVMLDEPERHLHRSISARLIEAAVLARQDCAFVILTHDLDLAASLSIRPGKVFAALGVEWSGNDPLKWSLHEVTTDTPLTEPARRAILGGRKLVLFVEGSDESLDISLYSALFPKWTVIPTGSCESVIRSVTGLNESDPHHWVHAEGIVDNDGRSEAECAALRTRRINALAVSEIENLYYLPDVLNAVAKKQEVTLGEEASALVDAARLKAVEALGKDHTLERVAKKIAKSELVRTMMSYVPTEVGDDEVDVKIPSPYPAILARLTRAYDEANYDDLVKLVPIRDTGFCTQVSTALKFRTLKDYQRAALVCITESVELAEVLKSCVADLDDISA